MCWSWNAEDRLQYAKCRITHLVCTDFERPNSKTFSVQVLEDISGVITAKYTKSTDGVPTNATFFRSRTDVTWEVRTDHVHKIYVYRMSAMKTSFLIIYLRARGTATFPCVGAARSHFTDTRSLEYRRVC